MTIRQAIWRTTDGREVIEEVDIPEPMGVSELATRRWLAQRGQARWSDADEAAYWVEWPARNPVSAFLHAQGQVVDEASSERIDGIAAQRKQRLSAGRTADGAKFIGFEGIPQPDEIEPR